jgi:hypothetical protein
MGAWLKLHAAKATAIQVTIAHRRRVAAAVLLDSPPKHGCGPQGPKDMDQDRIDAAIADAKAFFALPVDTKKQYAGIKGGARGYIPFGVETAKGATHHDLKEFWHMGRDLPPGHRFRATMADNVWPAEIPAFKHDVSWFYSALDSMGIYFTWAPKRGRSDAERNCISNIRPGGLGTVEAARKLLWLVAAARRLGATGVALKDEEPAALDAPQAAPALPQS